MKLISALIFITALCALTVFAQKTITTTEPANGPTYDEMVAKLKGGQTKMDYKALRMAFTQTKTYSPYGSDKDKAKAAFAALDGSKFKEAVAIAEEMLKGNYVDMDAHVIAAMAYGGLGDTANADFHKTVYLSLANSITMSGDGSSTKTAYVVISTSEEYVILRAFGLTPGSQALIHEGDHTYDVLTTTDQKTKAAVKIYFNIDIVWKAENDLFTPKP